MCFILLIQLKISDEYPTICKALSEELRESISLSLSQQHSSDLTRYLNDLQVLIDFLCKQTSVNLIIPLSGYMKQIVDSVPDCLSDAVQLHHVSAVWLLAKYQQACQLMHKHAVSDSNLVVLRPVNLPPVTVLKQLLDSSLPMAGLNPASKI